MKGGGTEGGRDEDGHETESGSDRPLAKGVSFQQIKNQLINSCSSFRRSMRFLLVEAIEKEQRTDTIGS